MYYVLFFKFIGGYIFLTNLYICVKGEMPSHSLSVIIYLLSRSTVLFLYLVLLYFFSSSYTLDDSLHTLIGIQLANQPT